APPSLDPCAGAVVGGHRPRRPDPAGDVHRRGPGQHPGRLGGPGSLCRRAVPAGGPSPADDPERAAQEGV
ncbi:MAG: hypothetical protein AVDCRST_MAG10-3324, partial [uncultured Acidimicrobiales bacterium]